MNREREDWETKYKGYWWSYNKMVEVLFSQKYSLKSGFWFYASRMIKVDEKLFFALSFQKVKLGGECASPALKGKPC